MSCSTLRMLNLDKFCDTWLRLGWRNTDLRAFCWTEFNLLMVFLSSPRAKRAGPKGLRAESARAVTGRRNSHRWEGGRLFELSAGFFYGNSCNSGTESRKIVSKVGN